MKRLRAAVRTENRAAGQRLAVIGELDVLWLRQVGEREMWCTNTKCLCRLHHLLKTFWAGANATYQEFTFLQRQ